MIAVGKNVMNERIVGREVKEAISSRHKVSIVFIHNILKNIYISKLRICKENLQNLYNKTY
jgi:hypothetical protein